MTGSGTSKSFVANKLNFSAKNGQESSALFTATESDSTPNCVKQLLTVGNGESKTPQTFKCPEENAARNCSPVAVARKTHQTERKQPKRHIFASGSKSAKKSLNSNEKQRRKRSKKI